MTHRILLILPLVLGITTPPAFAENCWSWGEPKYCGEFNSWMREIAEDVKRCMGEYHLVLHLPKIVILKAPTFYCYGKLSMGCTDGIYWIVVGRQLPKEFFRTLRHEIVHHILQVTGRKDDEHGNWQYFSQKCINRQTTLERDVIKKVEEKLSHGRD